MPLMLLLCFSKKLFDCMVFQRLSIQIVISSLLVISGELYGSFWELNYNSQVPITPRQMAKTEVVNRSLGNLLRSLVGEQPKQWHQIISQAKFAYNSSINRSTKKTPFEVVYGKNPNHVIDLLPFSNQARVSMDVEEFVAHVKMVHD